MKDAIHSLVAKVTIWSMRAALKGKWPTQGPFGESLLGARSQKAGLEFGNGYRLAYHGFKADAKAKKECRVFERSYMHNKVCEACMAEKPTSKNHDSLLTYKDFYPNAAHLLTELNHRDYLVSSTRISPWEPMPGFDFRTCFRDPMHTIFLGTAKEFLASCLGYWSRRGCLTGPDLQEQLRWVSQRQKECCAEAGLRCAFKTFTPSNTGLVTKSEYPELGSYFKAASVKTSIWFFGYLAQELAANAAEDKHWGNQTCFGKQFGL